MWALDAGGSAALATFMADWPWVAVASTAGVVLAAALRKRPRPAPPDSQRERVAPLREFKAELLGRKGEAAAARRIAELGLPALHDVVVTDERGATQIDHIVRTPWGIAVLETKRFSGLVTGTASAARWRQVVGGESLVVRSRGRRWRRPRRIETQEVVNWFQNPLRQNYRHVMAVTRIVDDVKVPVRGYVVSAGSAAFVGELARVVGSLERIGEMLNDPEREPVSWRLEAAWDRVIAAAQMRHSTQAASGVDTRRRR
jgi:hypothetical protein